MGYKLVSLDIKVLCKIINIHEMDIRYNYLSKMDV